MNTFTYVFEELRVYKDIELYAYGEADIEYFWNESAPDTGVMNKYATYEVAEIRLFPSIRGKSPMVIDRSSDLFKAIEVRLQEGSYDKIGRQIEEFCLNDDERI